MNEKPIFSNVETWQVESFPATVVAASLPKIVDEAIKLFDLKLIGGKVHAGTVPIRTRVELFAFMGLKADVNWWPRGPSKAVFYNAVKMRLTHGV